MPQTTISHVKAFRAYFERCSLSDGCLSSAGYQGAGGAHFHRAQLHQQLRLEPFGPVRGRAAVMSPQLPQSSPAKSVDCPPSADCGDDSRCLQQLSYGPPGDTMLLLEGINWQRTTVTENIWFSQRLCLCSGFSSYIISNLDGPQLYNHAINCFSFTWYDFRRW